MYVSFYFRFSEQTLAIFHKVSVDGIVKKKPKDSQTRLGVTQEPMTDANLQLLSPLHTLLRTWDPLIKLICLLSAGVFIFSSKPNILKENYNNYLKAKKDLKDLVKEKMHIIVEVPDVAEKIWTSSLIGSLKSSIISC